MKAKVLIMAIILSVASVGTVAADSNTVTRDNQSVFEINLLNYYAIQDLADTSFSRYTPGARMAFFITDWFGLSGDIILPNPFDSGSPGYGVILSTDFFFRYHHKVVDIYAGLGPAYDVVLADSTGKPLKGNVNYSVRLSFDYNITPVFALGVEANHIVQLDGLISGDVTYDAMRDIYLGIALKVKM